MFLWIKEALKLLVGVSDKPKKELRGKLANIEHLSTSLSPSDTASEVSTSGTASTSREASTLDRHLGGYPHPCLPGHFFGQSPSGSRLHIIRELTLRGEAALCGARVPKGSQHLRFRLGNDESRVCKNCFRLAKKGVR